MPIGRGIFTISRITVIPTETVILYTSTSSPARCGEPVDYTIAVIAFPSAPNGSIVSLVDNDDGYVFGYGTLSGGFAIITTSFSNNITSTFNVRANYLGSTIGATYMPSQSAARLQSVVPDNSVFIEPMALPASTCGLSTMTSADVFAAYNSPSTGDGYVEYKWDIGFEPAVLATGISINGSGHAIVNLVWPTEFVRPVNINVTAKFWSTVPCLESSNYVPAGTITLDVAHDTVTTIIPTFDPVASPNTVVYNVSVTSLSPGIINGTATIMATGAGILNITPIPISIVNGVGSMDVPYFEWPATGFYEVVASFTSTECWNNSQGLAFTTVNP